MGKYGKAAILARDLLLKHSNLDPLEAWNWAVAKVFPDSLSSREKSCPRGAFLGLCSEGLLHYIPPGSYTKSKDNRRYAIQAVKALSLEASLADRADELWEKVILGERKVQNSQMDVVISLWKAGAIEKFHA